MDANKCVNGAATDGGKACIPTFRYHEDNSNVRDIEDNTTKSKYLFNSFFSQDATQNQDFTNY